MGTPELAVPALRLLARRCRIGCVITQPDRPAGRGKRLRPPPVKQAAEELGLSVWQPERLRDHVEDERLQGADLFVVLAYGEILTQRLLDLPVGGCINLHASLLPRWRGASPLQAAIRAGDRRGGVSVMRMVRQLDAGPVYLQEGVDLPPRLRLPDWHDQVADLSARALDRFLDAWPAIEAVPQEEHRASYCGKLGSADGRLDFSQDCQAVDRHIRAYTPIPGCWTALPDGGRLRVLAAQPEPDVVHLAAGQVARSGGLVRIGCGSGALRVELLQPPGGRAMPVDAYCNGHRLPDRVG